MDYFTVFKLLLQYGADPSCRPGSYAQDITLKMAEYSFIDASKTSRHFWQDVILRNLSKSEYNGRFGKLEGYLAETGRRQLVLENGKELSLLPKNVHVQDGELEEHQCIYDEN